MCNPQRSCTRRECHCRKHSRNDCGFRPVTASVTWSTPWPQRNPGGRPTERELEPSFSQGSRHSTAEFYVISNSQVLRIRTRQYQSQKQQVEQSRNKLLCGLRRVGASSESKTKSERLSSSSGTPRPTARSLSCAGSTAGTIGKVSVDARGTFASDAASVAPSASSAAVRLAVASDHKRSTCGARRSSRRSCRPELS